MSRLELLLYWLANLFNSLASVSSYRSSSLLSLVLWWPSVDSGFTSTQAHVRRVNVFQRSSWQYQCLFLFGDIKQIPRKQEWASLGGLGLSSEILYRQKEGFSSEGGTLKTRKIKVARGVLVFIFLFRAWHFTKLYQWILCLSSQSFINLFSTSIYFPREEEKGTVRVCYKLEERKAVSKWTPLSMM